MTSPKDFPPLNARVELRVDEADDWHRSLVQDVTGGDVLVATPTDERGLNVFARVGDVVRIFWHTRTGPLELPTTLVAASGGSLAMWTLRPVGEPERASRRAFFRVPMTAPLVFGEPYDHLQATLVDLSEGGLRCHVRTDVGLGLGDTLTVRLALDGDTVEAETEVVRVLVHDLGQELGLRFLELSRGDSDVVRHHLFAEQRRLRARGLA